MVSMPPRRSCFGIVGIYLHVSRSVSMPPRRSCFEGWLKAAVAAFIMFQCHHGVPASAPGARIVVPEGEFQCHHGVPASTQMR